MVIHPSAEQGYSVKAKTYKEGRPDYPPAVVDWLKNQLALSDTSKVIDLGSGTGKFIPYLQAIKANVVAIEPVMAMRAQLQQSFPQIEVKDGVAENIPLPDQAVDAIVCAQSFHWFANQQAIQEMARVLKLGGRLGLVWNVRDESVDWVAALSAITNPYQGDTPRYYTMQWRQLFPNDLFTDLQLVETTNNYQGTIEDVIIKRTLSVSFIAKLSHTEQSKIIARVTALINETPCLAGKESIVFPYKTMMFSGSRIK